MWCGNLSFNALNGTEETLVNFLRVYLLFPFLEGVQFQTGRQAGLPTSVWTPCFGLLLFCFFLYDLKFEWLPYFIALMWSCNLRWSTTFPAFLMQCQVPHSWSVLNGLQSRFGLTNSNPVNFAAFWEVPSSFVWQLPLWETCMPRSGGIYFLLWKPWDLFMFLCVIIAFLSLIPKTLSDLRVDCILWNIFIFEHLPSCRSVEAIFFGLLTSYKQTNVVKDFPCVLEKSQIPYPQNQMQSPTNRANFLLFIHKALLW